MDRIRQIYDDDNARRDVLEAIRTLKKYHLFDALIWRSVPSGNDNFNTGDSEPMALAAGWGMGYKTALINVSDPFKGISTNDKKGEK